MNRRLVLAPERAERVKQLQFLRVMKARRLAADFRAFIPEAFGVLEPETRYLPNWHVDAIAEHLIAVSRGQIRNLVINIPPRHMKSMTVSVLWPAWEWASRASLKYLCAAYGKDLAVRDAVKMRALVESQWYRTFWGEPEISDGRQVELAPDQNSKEEFHNAHGGYRIAAGVGGALAGRGGDRLIVDDAHKPGEVESTVMRESVIDWWNNTMISRAQDPKTVAKVVVAQRVHERDLPGYLLDQGGWTHLNLPQEYEAKPLIYVKALPPLTHDRRTQDGELLWPARFGPAEISDAKKSGTYVYSAQYQQRPSPAGGGLLKREWFKYYLLPPGHMGMACELLVQSWDLAFKAAASSDKVAGQVWGKKGADVFLLDRINDRLDFPATCRAIESMSGKWPTAGTKLVEDKANGPAAIAELRNRVPGLIAVEPRGSKEARVAATSPYAEAGNVWLPHPSQAPWVEDFIAECVSFPRGAHDDDVDAFTQAVDRLMTTGGMWDMAEYAGLVLQDAQKDKGAAWTPHSPPSGNESRMTVVNTGRNW